MFPSGPSMCKTGKSSTESYIVSHNILLFHAAAYRRYFKVSKKQISSQRMINTKKKKVY
ncbi:hypothetical protein TanjilG_21751 [Lupinus angustifolius]|uniref:Uncharacterized protein n=1 Tax=Lupinus angustifolius TaxID=3871 RepID=A0A1J7I2J4_LUPAN|nr:hypothetical protein TanjilG_21751 [Lupinus angustifolius]